MRKSLPPWQDMRENWKPSDRSLKLAEALFSAEPTAEHVIIPMYMPKKKRGVWLSGQKVVTVEGAALIITPELPYSVARDLACVIADCELIRHSGANSNGTSGWALADRDGTWGRLRGLERSKKTCSHTVTGAAVSSRPAG